MVAAKPTRERHGWLRAALIDRGYMAKDLAQQWGVDDAVVSRFIKTGEPTLTHERMKILAVMLKISLDELSLRLDQDIPMSRPATPRRQNGEQEKPVVGAEDNGLEQRMLDLKAAADRVRDVLGTGMEVNVTFSCRGKRQ